MDFFTVVYDYEEKEVGFYGGNRKQLTRILTDDTFLFVLVRNELIVTHRAIVSTAWLGCEEICQFDTELQIMDS